jgi:hypothetical protein
MFFSNEERKNFECRVWFKARDNAKVVVGVLQWRCFHHGSHQAFSPSWEKIRVVLMTIADGAMLS